MKQKTLQLLAYIAKHFSPVTITSLLKLSYLIDLSYFTKNQKQISGFEYKRYTYGPFDKRIYEYVDELLRLSILTSKVEYANLASEYFTFEYKEDAEFESDKLKVDELETIDEVLNTLRGCGAKTLTIIAYKTKPMLALGATLGGSENIGVKLNMGAK